MATLPARPLLPLADPLAPEGDFGVPAPEPDPRLAEATARRIAEAYQKGKQRRRLTDLTREMYLLHVDGEGLSQWLTVHNGSRLRVPPNLDGSVRRQTNLLRPILQNFVNYHTSIPYRVVAEAASDRESQDYARIDELVANHLIRELRLNELVAEAVAIACAYGHCPVHAYWEEDQDADPLPSIYAGSAADPSAAPAPAGLPPQQGPQALMGGPMGPKPGHINAWVGDPWSTVYNPGATRRHVRWAIYERVFPLEVVQRAFPDVPLKGRKDLVSSSRYQRVVRSWMGAYQAPHGTAGFQGGGTDGEESIAVLFEENAEEGVLRLVALSGVADADQGGMGQPVLLHEAPLPGGRFSFVRFYSMDRFDDVLGKPFVDDLDELQVARNNLETRIWNAINRASRPPLAVGISASNIEETGGEEDEILESATGFEPYYLEYPSRWLQQAQAEMERITEDMWRIGAYQAASRGESRAGDPAAKTVMLERADDNILGAANRGIQGAIVEFLQLCHTLVRENLDVPWLLSLAGNEFGYIASPYVHKEQLSQTPPRFRIVSAFATTPETKAQQLLALLPMADALGNPLMTVKQLRKQYPDNSVWPEERDVDDIRERRICARNYAIKDAVRALREQGGMAENAPPEWTEYAAHQLFAQLYPTYPVLRDDNPQMALDGLSELTQDPTQDPLVARIAALWQDHYYLWMSQMAAQAMAAQAQMDGQSDSKPAARGDAASGSGASGPAGSPSSTSSAAPTRDSERMASLSSDVQSLTQQATA